MGFKISARSIFFFLFFVAITLVFIDLSLLFGRASALRSFVVCVTFALLGQSIFNLLTMLFSWNDPHTLHQRKAPKEFVAPKHHFTALVPVRNEPKVIARTLEAIDKIDYPNSLKEIIVICRSDDAETIEHAIAGSHKLSTHSVKILVSHKDIPNKPASLNLGLSYATGDVIVVFDAEDEPHKDIYKVVNTLMVKERVDVVQAGVQLMNYRSSWFAAMNCLEYYFWFKSSLHAFSSQGVVPLGGNTVFINKSKLTEISGWDEEKLTEDADVGIRLSLAGANIRVVYDEVHATREEVPDGLGAFIKQRSRWNQGFYQIFADGKWASLPTLGQKLFTAYLLLVPLVQLAWIFYVPLTLSLLLLGKIPILMALFSFVPAYLLLLQLTVFVLGLIDFCRDYHLHMPFWYPIKLLLTFFPYQIVLAFSSLRAFGRFIFSQDVWEKTEHHGNHRTASLMEGQIAPIPA
jgi:cellulose synthase/poly-beta-1,6-N-acetylglucosamine synthase-like glycosyltransferase